MIDVDPVYHCSWRRDFNHLREMCLGNAQLS